MTSFPVGKIDFLDLAPLNFFEFMEEIIDKNINIKIKLSCFVNIM